MSSLCCSLIDKISRSISFHSSKLFLTWQMSIFWRCVKVTGNQWFKEKVWEKILLGRDYSLSVLAPWLLSCTSQRCQSGLILCTDIATCILSIHLFTKLPKGDIFLWKRGLNYFSFSFILFSLSECACVSTILKSSLWIIERGNFQCSLLTLKSRKYTLSSNQCAWNWNKSRRLLHCA